MVKPADRKKGSLYSYFDRDDSILVYLAPARDGIAMFFKVWPYNPHGEDLTFLAWKSLRKLKPAVFNPALSPDEQVGWDEHGVRYPHGMKHYIMQRVWEAKWK